MGWLSTWRLEPACLDLDWLGDLPKRGLCVRSTPTSSFDHPQWWIQTQTQNSAHVPARLSETQTSLTANPGLTDLPTQQHWLSTCPLCPTPFQALHAEAKQSPVQIFGGEGQKTYQETVNMAGSEGGRCPHRSMDRHSRPEAKASGRLAYQASPQGQLALDSGRLLLLMGSSLPQHYLGKQGVHSPPGVWGLGQVGQATPH